MNDNEEQTHEVPVKIYPLFIQLLFSQIWIEDDYSTIGVNGDVNADLENEDKNSQRYILAKLLFNIKKQQATGDE